MKRLFGFLVLVSYLLFACNKPQVENLALGETLEFITVSKQDQFYKAVQSTVKILALSMAYRDWETTDKKIGRAHV